MLAERQDASGIPFPAAKNHPAPERQSPSNGIIVYQLKYNTQTFHGDGIQTNSYGISTVHNARNGKYAHGRTRTYVSVG